MARPQPVQAPTTRSVKVIRQFYYDRKLMKEGEIVDLPIYFAREMVSANKAQNAGQIEEPIGPMTVSSASALTGAAPSAARKGA